MINIKLFFSFMSFFILINVFGMDNEDLSSQKISKKKSYANKKTGDDNKIPPSHLYEKVPFYSTALLAGYLSKDVFPLTTKGLLVSAAALGTGIFLTSKMVLAGTTQKGGKGKPINITWLTTSFKCLGWLVSALAVNGALNCAAKAPLYINGDAFLKNIVMPIFVRRHTFN